MINLFGSAFGNIGYGVLTRELARAINRTEKVALFPVYANATGFVLDSELASIVERRLTMRHDDPSVYIGYPQDYMRFTGKPRVGFAVFEGTRLPDTWRFHMEQMDRLWVMSEWGRRVLKENGFDGARIDVVPGGFDPEVFTPNTDDEHWDSPVFRFLTVGKFEARKGTADMIRAYADEFRPEEPVELWVHAHNPFVEGFDIGQELKRLGLDKLPRMRLLARRENAQQMAEVYRSCHCFISAVRAEGWGLPLTEALGCGLPAIATDYGPHREYASPKDTFFIPVERLEPTNILAPGLMGDWAIPDVKQLRKLMREAYESRKKLRKMGQAAAKRMRAEWTWDHAAAKALAALRPPPPAPKKRSRKK